MRRRVTYALTNSSLPNFLRPQMRNLSLAEIAKALTEEGLKNKSNSGGFHDSARSSTVTQGRAKTSNSPQSSRAAAGEKSSSTVKQHQSKATQDIPQQQSSSTSTTSIIRYNDSLLRSVLTMDNPESQVLSANGSGLSELAGSRLAHDLSLSGGGTSTEVGSSSREHNVHGLLALAIRMYEEDCLQFVRGEIAAEERAQKTHQQHEMNGGPVADSNTSKATSYTVMGVTYPILESALVSRGSGRGIYLNAPTRCATMKELALMSRIVNSSMTVATSNDIDKQLREFQGSRDFSSSAIAEVIADIQARCDELWAVHDRKQRFMRVDGNHRLVDGTVSRPNDEVKEEAIFTSATTVPKAGFPLPFDFHSTLTFGIIRRLHWALFANPLRSVSLGHDNMTQKPKSDTPSSQKEATSVDPIVTNVTNYTLFGVNDLSTAIHFLVESSLDSMDAGTFEILLNRLHEEASLQIAEMVDWQAQFTALLTSLTSEVEHCEKATGGALEISPHISIVSALRVSRTSELMSNVEQLLARCANILSFTESGVPVSQQSTPFPSSQDLVGLRLLFHTHVKAMSTFVYSTGSSRAIIQRIDAGRKSDSRSSVPLTITSSDTFNCLSRCSAAIERNGLARQAASVTIESLLDRLRVVEATLRGVKIDFNAPEGAPGEGAGRTKAPPKYRSSIGAALSGRMRIATSHPIPRNPGPMIGAGPETGDIALGHRVYLPPSVGEALGSLKRQYPGPISEGEQHISDDTINLDPSVAKKHHQQLVAITRIALQTLQLHLPPLPPLISASNMETQYLVAGLAKGAYINNDLMVAMAPAFRIVVENAVRHEGALIQDSAYARRVSSTARSTDTPSSASLSKAAMPPQTLHNFGIMLQRHSTIVLPNVSKALIDLSERYVTASEVEVLDRILLFSPNTVAFGIPKKVDDTLLTRSDLVSVAQLQNHEVVESNGSNPLVVEASSTGKGSEMLDGSKPSYVVSQIWGPEEADEAGMPIKGQGLGATTPDNAAVETKNQASRAAAREPTLVLLPTALSLTPRFRSIEAFENFYLAFMPLFDNYVAFTEESFQDGADLPNGASTATEFRSLSEDSKLSLGDMHTANLFVSPEAAQLAVRTKHLSEDLLWQFALMLCKHIGESRGASHDLSVKQTNQLLERLSVLSAMDYSYTATTIGFGQRFHPHPALTVSALLLMTCLTPADIERHLSKFATIPKRGSSSHETLNKRAFSIPHSTISTFLRIIVISNRTSRAFSAAQLKSAKMKTNANPKSLDTTSEGADDDRHLLEDAMDDAGEGDLTSFEEEAAAGDPLEAKSPTKTTTKKSSSPLDPLKFERLCDYFARTKPIQGRREVDEKGTTVPIPHLHRSFGMSCLIDLPEPLLVSIFGPESDFTSAASEDDHRFRTTSFRKSNDIIRMADGRPAPGSGRVYGVHPAVSRLLMTGSVEDLEDAYGPNCGGSGVGLSTINFLRKRWKRILQSDRSEEERQRHQSHSQLQHCEPLISLTFAEEKAAVKLVTGNFNTALRRLRDIVAMQK